MKGIFFDVMLREYVARKHATIYTKRRGIATNPAKNSRSYSLECELTNAERKLLYDWLFLSLRMGKTQQEKAKLNELDSVISKDEKLHRIKQCIALENAYESLRIHSDPDFLVFTPQTIIAYEFKSGKSPTFSQTQEIEFAKIRESNLPAQIRVLMVDYPFPNEYEISCYMVE